MKFSLYARADASFSGEELEVTFSAVAEQTDFGVPRSPTWTEFSNPTVESISLLGVDFPFSCLPPDVQAAVLNLVDDESVVFTVDED